MKKYFYLVLIFVFSTIGLSAQKYLNGKVKVVDVFPDYKVRVVKTFPDLKVKVVKYFPDSPGEWQFVDTFEDFTIKYVDAFEDFTIQFVDVFPGPTSSQNTTRNAPEKIVATTKNTTSKSTEYNGKHVVVVSGSGGTIESRAKFYNVTIDKDSFSVDRLPGRRFPLNARVQIVDTLPDLIIDLSTNHAFPTLRLEMDTVASSKKKHWQVVDTLPDFKVMFYDYWRWCDIDIDVANYYDNEAIHTLIYNSRILSEKQYPNPNEKAPLPNCKERR